MTARRPYRVRERICAFEREALAVLTMRRLIRRFTIPSLGPFGPLHPQDGECIGLRTREVPNVLRLTKRPAP